MILSHYRAGTGALLVETREESRLLQSILAELPTTTSVCTIAAPGGPLKCARTGKAESSVTGLIPAYQWASAGPGRVLVCYDWHCLINNAGHWRALLEALPGLRSPKGAGQSDPASLVVFVGPSWDIQPTNPLRGLLPKLDFAPPDRAALGSIAGNLHKLNGEREQVIDALCGLSADAAEQAAAEVLARTGGKWDVEALRGARRQGLREAGLEIWPAVTELGGLQGLQDFAQAELFPWVRDPQLSVRRLLCAGLPGVGKCLGKGTPVLMFDGSIKPVEEVHNGDLLMGPDSNPRTVCGVTQGFGPLYRVVPTKGEPYVVNADHILSLKKTGTEEIVNVSIKEYFQKGEATRTKLKGWRAETNWPTMPTAIPPYILGVWLGDGTSTAPYVTTADEEIFNELQAYANEIGLKLQPYQQKGLAKTYGITQGNVGSYPKGGNEFLEGLRSYSLLGNKRIPREYLINDRSSRLQLLAGLIDTDGYLCNSGTGSPSAYEISSKHSKLASDILFLARSLGFAAYVSATEKFDQYGGGGVYFRIQISGDIDEIPVRINRKKAKPRQQIKDVLKTGITVESIGEGDYYGFQVDGDHLFLLGDFTVTHNSYCARWLAAKLGCECARLSIPALKAGIVGASEGNLRRALRTLDAMGAHSPIVAVLDEIDTIARDGLDGGTSSGMFAELLTWLQESTSQVVVVATLNRLDKLDAALESRFQARFFFSLPNHRERLAVSAIHYARLGCADVDGASRATADYSEGFSSRELAEHIIPSVARLSNRKPTAEVIAKIALTFTPASKTQVEQLAAMTRAASTLRRANDAEDSTPLTTGRRIASN